MLLYLIIGCEIGFWIFLFVGLFIRYFFRSPKLSKAVLLCVPLLDFILLCATALDLHNGSIADFAHGLAAVYLGFTLVYGASVIKWADQHIAYCFASGEKPDQPPSGGWEYTFYEWQQWGKGVAAGVIAWVLLALAIAYVDQPERTSALNEWFAGIFWVLAIWLLVWPVWYSIFPKKLSHKV
ncbi:hypothetical protein CBP51_18465 [Cellvibrio mixtus]|uniref:Uncharacterized protein n=1 Tax=Cellvibrio mixtus TaxID=39650 RepID=A0A266Q5F8_9GAMM|nr:hypothetical protein CBP51_18465 [Cellvibrio mixtus]